MTTLPLPSGDSYNEMTRCRRHNSLGKSSGLQRLSQIFPRHMCHQRHQRIWCDIELDDDDEWVFS